MFKIIKGDGTTVDMTDGPAYIRLQENGCFGLCPADAASGIVHNGTVYHLMGRPELEGAETIRLEEADAGAVLSDAQSAIDALVVASLGGDAALSEIQAAIDDLVVVSLEGGERNV